MALEENKKINRKISEARQAAEQASRSKTQFLANMSHDIRTPMNAIVGLTKLMQYSLNDPETLDSYIQKLQSSSEYLLGLINDILDLSKIESGSIELKKESMNLRKVAEQAERSACVWKNYPVIKNMRNTDLQWKIPE